MLIGRGASPSTPLATTDPQVERTRSCLPHFVSLSEVGATILFADEASVRTDYHAGTTSGSDQIRVMVTSPLVRGEGGSLRWV